jgi:uncharacterized protein
MDIAISQQSHQIAQLCSDLGVQRLDVFGSAAKSQSADAPRDFDFVVALGVHAQLSKARRWIALAEGLEMLLGKHVDLVSEASLTSPYFIKTLTAQRQNVYQRA